MAFPNLYLQNNSPLVTRGQKKMEMRTILHPYHLHVKQESTFFDKNRHPRSLQLLFRGRATSTPGEIRPTSHICALETVSGEPVQILVTKDLSPHSGSRQETLQ